MKKAIAVLVFSMILIFTACAPKEYPVQELAIGSYSLNDDIKAEADEKITLNLSGILEDTSVEASIDNVPVSVDENYNISFKLNEIKTYTLNVTLNADRYEPVSLSWNITALPHTIDIEFEDENKNPEFPEGTKEFSLNVSATRENAEFYIEPEESGEFIPDEEQKETGRTTGTLKLKLPEQGSEDYKITVTAKNSETVSETVTASIIPKLKIGMSLAKLDLAYSQEGKIELYPEIPNTDIKVSVLKGDAKAELNGNTIIITGGQKKSTIYIKGEASGYIPFEGYINVNAAVYASNSNQQPSQTISTANCDHILDGIFKETNKRRIENGLEPLERIKAVDTPAMIRAKETDKLWSHTRPDGRDCFTVYEDTGLKYDSMGENLFSATKYLEPDKVVDAWMNSPAHRQNVLQPIFKGIGLGYYEGETYNFWVQLFVG